MGSLEGHERQDGGDLLDTDHEPKRCDLSRPGNDNLRASKLLKPCDAG
jgi:hypothetical protein